MITSDRLEIIKEIKGKLKQAFKIKDLGELKYFLGIEFAKLKKGIVMHQRKYFLKLIYEFGVGGSKHALIPLDISVKLTKK